MNQGYLPKSAQELVERWRMLHQQELSEVWVRARLKQPLLAIAALE